MLVSRYPIGAIGGHCDQTGFPPNKLGPEWGPEKGKASGAAEARQAVRLQVKYGADVIKMCVSGGVLSLGDDVQAPQMTDEEIAAAVDEAHRLGRKTAAHAHGDLAARAAVKAGIDSIEHGSFMTDETLALMKAKGTYLVPTLLIGDWVTRPEAKLPPNIAAKAKAAVSVRSDMFRRALKAGVKIAFGTDAALSYGIQAREFGLMTGARNDVRRPRCARRARPLPTCSASPRRSARSRRARRPTSSPSPATPSPTSTPPKRCPSS